MPFILKGLTNINRHFGKYLFQGKKVEEEKLIVIKAKFSTKRLTAFVKNLKLLFKCAHDESKFKVINTCTCTFNLNHRFKYVCSK